VCLRVFEQLLCFWIVFCFDLFVVDKGLFGAGVFVDLETVVVEVVFCLVSADISYNDVLGHEGTFDIIRLSSTLSIWSSLYQNLENHTQRKLELEGIHPLIPCSSTRS
jgi:hypothetical protein